MTLSLGTRIRVFERHSLGRTIMERWCKSINGHSLRAVGDGEEQPGMRERYIVRPCPVCEVPIEIEWPLGRSLTLIHDSSQVDYD